MTGEVDTQGRVTSVGGIAVKLEPLTPPDQDPHHPRENLYGGDAIDRLPDALNERTPDPYLPGVEG